MSNQTLAYNMIKDYYKDNKAKRSQLPLMNHIDEGIAILRAFNAGQSVIDAFCLHPLDQNNVHYDVTDEIRIASAMSKMYSIYANAGLCTEYWDTTHPRIENQLEGLPKMPYEISLLLYADKVQNQKDFLVHHLGTHDRSQALNKYFINWIAYLRPLVFLDDQEEL